MTWRDPRGPREFVDGDCKNLSELADTYHPFIRWSDSERFFPALAEAWLQHATSAPWPPSGKLLAGAPPVETGYDRNRRGTSVCQANPDVTDVRVLGGTPNADDQPLSLDDAPGDPRAIAAYHQLDGSSFLNFGGWVADAGPHFQGRQGDLDYLYRSFSELAAAINPAMSWQPADLMAHLPQFWTAQPPTPTVYCEARMAGDFADVSALLDHPDFPPLPSNNPLGDVMALTYHYLFPAREPAPGEPDVRAKEGQWEAVSIFFRANRDGDQVRFVEPPLGVAVSQGTDGPSATPNATDFRPWPEVHHEITHAHPILFASQGTHRFFFAPLDPGQPFVPGTGGPTIPGGGSYDNNSEFPGWESLLIGGLIIAAILLAAGLWVAAIVVAVITFLLWLLSLILDACSDDSENPSNPFPSNPEAQGDGSQSGDPDEPPAPGSPGGDGSPGGGGGPGGSGGGGFGVPNAGSPTGRNTSSFDVRFIDRVTRGKDDRPKYTSYPSAEQCENPPWWDYNGRWGVRVAPGLSSSWASGDQRVDEHGRSWGYWHTLRFLQERLAGHV